MAAENCESLIYSRNTLSCLEVLKPGGRVDFLFQICSLFYSVTNGDSKAIDQQISVTS